MRKVVLVFGFAATVGAAFAGFDTEAFARPRLMTCGYRLYDNCMNTILYRVSAADRAADARWAACRTPEELKAFQREVRAKALEVFDGFPERCPLNPRTTGTIEGEGYRIEKVMFESRPNFHVTAHLYLPTDPQYKAPYPTILVCCGHNAKGKVAPPYSNAGLSSARKGFATLVYDPVEQGERHQLHDDPAEAKSVLGHNRIGQRAWLLGTSMAQVRIYDGMRAIDYLETRKDVADVSRLSVMGMSGGGTLSAYMNAFDDRIKAAAPAGYLTTMRDLYDHWGPQDSEQNIFGQLKYGLNHLGLVCLRAPSPIMITASYADAFPYAGVMTLKERADEVFRNAGAPDAVTLCVCPGVHHWYPSQKESARRWFRKWTCGDKTAMDFDTAAIRRMDVGFAYTNGTEGTWSMAPARRNVTPTGGVLELPGERSMYDIYRDRLAAFDKVRPELTPDVVRRATGIRPVAELGVAELAVEPSGTAVLSRDDDFGMIPVVIARPEVRKDPPPVLIISDTLVRASLTNEVASLLAAGRTVAVADVRGYGENSKPRHGYYTQFEKNKWPDEQMAIEMYALGDSLVARRAEDISLAARYVAKAVGAKPVLRAEGRACVSAAHAAYLDRELFAGLEMADAPVSWRKVVEDDSIFYSFSLLVHGALRSYDWMDLAAAVTKVR